MSSAPFDSNLVIERIKSATGALAELREVGGAANYAAIKALGDFPSPAAYVLMPRETNKQTQSSPSGQSHKSGRQVAEVSIGIALAVRNYRVARGVQDSAELNQMLGALRDRLIKWIPDAPGARALQWVAGDLIDYNDATQLWVDVYQTQHFIGGGNP